MYILRKEIKLQIKRAQKQNVFCILPNVRILSKKTIFLLAIALCLVVQNQAQAQRRLPSQMGIQFTGGTVNGFNLDAKSDGFGFHFGTAITNYTKHGNYWKFGGEYLQKQYLYEDWKLP